MKARLLVCAVTVLGLSSGMAGAQTTMPATSGQNSSQPFSFQGDQIQQFPDQPQKNVASDPRYSQTYQQQQNGTIPKPGGGCLKYGAVGAVGGHLAGHGVVGALAGCVTGAYVKHRDKARIAEQYGKQ